LSNAPESVILVASSESTLKSSPVRRTLEQRLTDDLKFAVRRAGFDRVRVEKDAARLVVCGADESTAAARACSRVFGVAYAASAYLLVNTSLEQISQRIVTLARLRLRTGQSFAIRAHRSGPGAIPRREVELAGGREVLQATKRLGITVDLEDPDVTFYVDLVGRDAYVYTEKFQGPGGLPLSSQWKMLAVLDSGPLTILAACAMMRRGCVVELFIPVSHTITSLATEIQLNLAKRLANLVTRPNYKAFTVEIDHLLGDRAIDTTTGPAGWREVARLVAMRFAKAKRFRGLVLGNVGGRLDDIGSAHFGKTELPIFYPLLGLEREDLSELSRLVDITESELASQEELECMLSTQVDASLFESLTDSVVQEVQL